MTSTIPGVVSSNGTAYGPPAKAVAWGSPGCPILPARIREHLESVEVPVGLSRLFGMDLTYDQLDSEILGRSNLDGITGQGRNIVRDAASGISALLLNEILIPDGIPLTWLQALPISPRTKNAIQTAFSERLEDDQLDDPLSVGEFLRIPGVGITMSIELLCVMESAERGQLGEVDLSTIDDGGSGFDRVAFKWAVEQASQRRMKAFSPLIEPMQLFAGWAQSETDADSLGEAIDAAMAHGASVQQWNVVASVSLSSLSPQPRHPYAILDSWSEELDDRETVILRRRICGDERITLAEVARMFAVSRERIRQLEARVRRKLRLFLYGEGVRYGEAARPIHWRASTLRNVLGVAAPRDHAEELLKAPSDNNDYRAILLDIAGPYALEDQWLVRRESQSDDPTHNILLGADEFGRIDTEAAASELAAWGLNASLHREWLTRSPAIRDFNGKLVRWGASVGDRLAFALADLDRPATIDELMDHTREDRSRGSALNALASDLRVIKVDQARYALRSWGLSEFKNIAYTIRDLIRETGHPLPIDDVVDHVTQTFGVAESSVRQYVHAPMFVVHSESVRLRTRDEPFQYPRGSMRRAQGVFALGSQRVALVRRVDSDLVRGSGRILTFAAGDILGVEVNSRIMLRSSEGDTVTLTYPESSIVGPSIGSVRALAERLSAKVGDHLTLIMDRSNLTIEARLTPTEWGSPGWDLVSRLTGVDAQSGLDGLSKSLLCSREEVRSILRSRGDEVVLEALPAQTTPSSLSLALDELGDQIRAGYGRPS